MMPAYVQGAALASLGQRTADLRSSGVNFAVENGLCLDFGLSVLRCDAALLEAGRPSLGEAR